MADALVERERLRETETNLRNFLACRGITFVPTDYYTPDTPAHFENKKGEVCTADEAHAEALGISVEEYLRDA